MSGHAREEPVIEKTKARCGIRVLDDCVANKIAAGEVVERPASVVKELVENALDAHATRIEVHLDKGGAHLIRVIDDGWGMTPGDLGRAFLPHATSKLAEVEDLESIATLGFRGEALASIGAVSQARILSRARGETEGYAVENDGGRLSPARAAAAAPGTEVTIRNLFFNTPARARFLRTERTERGHVEELLRRYALAFPETGFKLVQGGHDLFQVAAGDDRLARLGQLYGADLARRLLPVRAEAAEGRLEGFLGPPSVSRPNARELHFFVNGRYIRDKILHRIVRDAYRDAMHPGRYPIVYLFLEMDPAEVDVNVHPTKAEVRWRRPGFLHSVVRPALARALRLHDLSGRWDQGDATEDDHRGRVRKAMADYLRRADPEAPGGGFGHGGRVQEDAGTGAGDGERPFSVFQVHDSYLVCEVADGIAIVDQHALHERVQYDRILARLMEGGVQAQALLVPEQVELDPEALGLLEENAGLLHRCGIEWSRFSERSVALEAIPAVLPRDKAAELVRDLIEILRLRGRQADARVLFHAVADTMACKAAVRFGDRLSREEARALLEESGALDRAFVCPHGRPTVLRLDFAELERRFRRR